MACSTAYNDSVAAVPGRVSKKNLKKNNVLGGATHTVSSLFSWIFYGALIPPQTPRRLSRRFSPCLY